MNTAITYSLYCFILPFLGYQCAYLLIYLVGIVFSYCFNSLVVFKIPLSWKGLFAFPLVYLIQYTLSALSLKFLVKHFGLSEQLAPLVILIFLAPLLYSLIQWLLNRIHKSRDRI